MAHLLRLVLIAGFSALLISSAPAQTAPDSTASAPPQESLGDYAKRLRANKQPEVVISEDDARTLFKEVDSILTFASQSSGLPKHALVKYKLVGREEVDKHFADNRSNDEAVKKIQHSEIVLKKFGLLPDDFHIDQYLKGKGGADVAGFYDLRDKTMYLLNWIPLEQQRLVMAHELTHALQDQNFDLMKWRNFNGAGKAGDDDAAEKAGIETEARLAATEGQAMLVYLDYEIMPLGIKLADSTDRFDVLKNRILSVYDQPVVFHSAPMIFTESAKFPYFDGFTFELELLKRSGIQGAFAGIYARPPRDTHEIIHPEDYLSETRDSPFGLPNLVPALGSGYRRYDSGSVGELDIRIMAKQFGRDNDAYSVSPYWNGAAFLAVRKPSAVSKPESEIKPSDLALVFVSRWKSAAAAQRFAEIYKASIISRSRAFDAASAKGVSCSAKTPDCTMRWYAHFTTDEEAVAMEIGADNTLIITQGLDDATVKQVKIALGRATPDTSAALEPELTMRVMDFPAVRAMQREILQQLLTKDSN
jgi:hypothetical protein